VIEEYLPAEATEAEITAAIEKAIAETGAASMKDMGKVMKACMAHFSGRLVDGAKVSELVKTRLG